MAMGPAAGAASAEYTIDELARVAGTTVRSLRVYHERGVLPPPQVKGRTGYYGAEHLNRVHTIGRLLDRGIKINGIRELLDAWDRGDDLADVLGVTDKRRAAITNRGRSTISAPELENRYHDVPNGLARVVTAGLYEPVDAMTYRIADLQLDRLGTRLVEAGVPRSEVVEELERLCSDCDRIARRQTDLLYRTLCNEYQQSSPAEITALTDQLTTLRRATSDATSAMLSRFIVRYQDQDTEALVGH